MNRTKALPWVMLHEMLDPVDEGVAVSFVARVGHLSDHEELHLPLVIEGRADLEQCRPFRRPTRLTEVWHQAGVLRAGRPAGVGQAACCDFGSFGGQTGTRTAHSALDTPSVALVMMTEVPDPNRRRRRYSATSIGAALSARFFCARPVRSTQ